MKVILLSAIYKDRKAVLKFYEPVANRVILLRDQTDHKSHCYTTIEESKQLMEYDGIESIEEIEILDVIRDEKIKLANLTCRDPLVVGGTENSIREKYKTWESDIKYYQTYLYDKGLTVGKWYELSHDGLISPLDFKTEIDLSLMDTKGVIDVNKFEDCIKKWANLLDEPIPEIKRLAFDIEVESSRDSLPDPSEASQRVTAISFISNDNLKKVFVLKRIEIMEGEVDKEKEYELKFYDSEKQMLEDSFKIIESYPVVLTFNGDIFDMPYLYNRAIALGIENIPLHMMKRNSTLNLGIHVDMYGVFSNHSLKIYAFNNKYVENSLDSVSEALIKENKIKYDGELNQIPLNLLAKYCFNDARLTLKLSTYNNNLVMNLLVLLCRIGNMPIDDISRLSISHWIKSMFYGYHRQNNELIPRSDDFPKVESSTTATIEGKKYQGAIVLEPQKGIHFDVTVMDFASLYTSLVKNNNISYETVCCQHGQLWEKTDNKTKWLLYQLLKYINNEEYHNLCLVEEKENLLKIIKKEIGNMLENIEKNILKNQENQQEKHIKKPCQIQSKENNTENPEIKQVKNGLNHTLKELEKTEENTQKQKNINNTCQNIEKNGFRNGEENNDKNFIIQKEINVKSVAIEIVEHLKSIMLTGDKNAEIVYNSLKMIGQNSNYYVQIVTVLLQGLQCKSHKIPQTNHWSCTKKIGASALLLGALKELRVNHFKKLWRSAKSDNDKERYDTITQALKVFLNACFTADTEVLTINGIKKITDLEVGDKLYTLNPKTLEIEISPIIETQSFNYNDELINIKNKNYDWKITKNHNFYLHHKLSKTNNLEWLKAEELIGNYQVPLQKNKKGKNITTKNGYPIIPLLKLLGWYISEGSLIYYKKYNSYRITITQKNKEKLKEIAELVKLCKMKPNVYEKTVEFYSKKFYTLVESWCGKGSYNKHLPNFIWKLSPSLKKYLFETMYEGDGTKSQPQYNTVSTKLRDDVMRLCLELGMTPHYRTDSDTWRIITNIHSRTIRHTRSISKEKFNGKVYCCTVKNNHIIFAGRNGKMGWIGQSYGVTGFEKFPLYFLPTAESITALAREVLSKTIEIAKKSGMVIIAGDTDSMFTKKPTQEQIKSLIEYVEKTYNIDLEVDKEYRYVVFSNRKKNYFGIKKDGKEDIKGLTGKKSHTPPFIKKMFNEMMDTLKKIEKPEQFEPAKESISSLIRNKIENFDSIPLEEMAFKYMVSRPLNEYKVKPPAVKAAELLGRHIHVGEFIQFVKTWTKPNVKPIQIVQRKEIDKEKYLEFIESTLGQITEPLDIDFDILLGKGKATKLTDFV